MKKLFAVLLAGLCLSISGCAATEGIEGDVNKLRESNKAAHAQIKDQDVSAVVNKHIPIGTTQAQAEANLKAQKFDLHYMPVGPDQNLTI